MHFFQHYFTLFLLLFGMLGALAGGILNKLGFYLPTLIYKNYLFFGMPSKMHASQRTLKANFAMILLASGLSVLIFYHFGFHLITLLLILFSYFLLLLSHIDYYHYLLPDCIVFSLLWLGLLFNAEGLITAPTDAILGSIVGYLALWSIGFIFRYIRKKEGIGYGDMKLLAALGAWLGLKALLPILLIACSFGAFIGLLCAIYRKDHCNNLMPFAPFLATGGVVVAIVLHPMA